MAAVAPVVDPAEPSGPVIVGAVPSVMFTVAVSVMVAPAKVPLMVAVPVVVEDVSVAE